MNYYCEYLFTWMEGFWHAVDAHLARMRGDKVAAAEFDNASFEAQRRLDLMKWRNAK